MKQGDEMKAVIDALKSEFEPKLKSLEEQVKTNADFRVNREATIPVADQALKDMKEDFETQLVDLKDELRVSVRGLLYHVCAHHEHPEIDSMLAGLGSFEDWLKMRDPDDETGIRDCQIMLSAPPIGAGAEE